jgi:5-oxoprolinase (ATP-hydrolysing)
VGYSSDTNADGHAARFEEQGKVVKGYRGADVHADEEGNIVRGLSGEAVRIIKRPSLYVDFSKYIIL